MTKNPFYNALLALAYVFIVVNVIRFITNVPIPEPEDNMLMPIAMLSLFTLSAAVMTYLFFYQPTLMLLDGRRREAVHFFVRTLATFAALTVAMLLLVFVTFH